MKNIIKSIGDLRVSVVLFLLFALFCALATFIESAYGTPRLGQWFIILFGLNIYNFYLVLIYYAGCFVIKCLGLKNYL